MASKVLHNLYLGDLWDAENAAKNGFDVSINVLEDPAPDEIFPVRYGCR